MPDETVIDGEAVALDEKGRPPTIQCTPELWIGLVASALFFIFDLPVLQGRDVMEIN
jgi:ATP-dependent DNA ligase